ncbi:MAG: aminomethyl-transferring glycine dehydrogenase [Chloroflexi bacterium]|nr:aminomethyl-transferring glycine dehydrogenase [Chloroflexota bacterium]
MSVDLGNTDPFARRHIGPGPEARDAMLQVIGRDSLDDLIEATVPESIRLSRPLELPEALGEHAALARLKRIAGQNEVWRSYIGMGYGGTLTPPVIQRNILENPGWYTQYTPYQAEIAQGRLEALLNYQTLVTELTGMEIANASLLDEGTAAAEAMSMAWSVAGQRADRAVFFVSQDCHPQTLAVVQTRAEPLGIEVRVGDHASFDFDASVFGGLVQYPASDGRVEDHADFCARAHAVGALAIVAADLLSLALLTPPGEWGADVVIGNSQRFGVPMGYGGPHAAFFATREEHKRRMPGRLIGVTLDANGDTAFRMALQTREQHIRREKATSNICTAQVLLAVMAGMYGVWHGPDGIRRIAGRVNASARVLAAGLTRMGHRLVHDDFFDTLRIDPVGLAQGDVHTAAEARRINLRYFADGTVGIALDETVTEGDLDDLLAVFDVDEVLDFSAADLAAELAPGYPGAHARRSDFMTHPIFQRFHSETDMMRYIKSLEAKDLSLTHSMIPLGSCTMKLNAAAELFPVTWPEFGQLHPFAPLEQTAGYQQLFDELETWLAEITGLPAVSLQPNSGAQGEYAGLQVIRAWHLSRGEDHRRVCLIPSSAHGTNPASAVMAGMDVVVVATDAHGNVDIADLRAKAEQHADRLAALMITYPSTHGVFETGIREICEIVHAKGGQVYMDGANMNAQVGLCRPGDFGADVLHLNLHKTFAIPHGGGGPGMGPIAAAEHLAAFLPGHPVIPTGGDGGLGPISAAPWGSASILVISWMYIAMLGPEGVADASRYAILNANYMAARLRGHYDVLYTGAKGTVAHEFILDLRQLKADSGISEVDVAKRLADYGFHAPTMSWPVGGTIMIEPTESESKVELDRLCDALIGIRAEIQDLLEGRSDAENNPLKRAPHTAAVVTADRWDRPYSRQQAAFPSAWTRDTKFWPSVGRVDDVYGDRNLICACPPIESYYAEDAALEALAEG